MSNIDVNDLTKKFLSRIKEIPLNNLIRITNILENEINSKPEVNDFEEDVLKFPSLKIPPELLPNFIEELFVSFIEETFNNFENDYSVRKDTDSSLVSKVAIRTSYNTNDESDMDQYVKVTVICDGISSRTSGLSNLDNNRKASQEMNVAFRRAECNFPIRINIRAQVQQEATFIGSIIYFSLISAAPVIRKILNLNSISYPTLTASRPYQSNQDLFISVINFEVNKTVFWTQVAEFKKYNNVIIRLLGRIVDDQNSPIIQTITRLSIPVNERIKLFLNQIKGIKK